MGEIERLKQELKEALDKINEIDKKLDKIKAKESRKGKWKPEERDTYYYIDSWRCNNLKIFGTREECIQYKNFIDELNKRKYEFSVEEWKDANIYKYCIYYGYGSKTFWVNMDISAKELSSTYFKTKKDAQYIIDNYKEELLKYCFGME